MNVQYEFFAPAKLDWLKKARQKAREIAQCEGRVDADRIWEECPIPKEIPDRRIMGAVFVGFKRVAKKQSKRSICHHREISIFTLPTNK